MSWRDDLANQIANAETFEGGSYFVDGAYPDLIVENLKMNQGHSGVSFIGEFRVQTAHATEAGITPNAPGSTASVAYNVTKHQAAALSNIKKLALALSGLTQDQLDAEQTIENSKAAAEGRHPCNLLAEWIKRATNDSASAGTVQPLRGTRVSGETYRQATRAQKASNAPRSDWNCYVKFRHVPDQTAESIAAGREILGTVSAPPAPPPAAPVVEAAAPPPAAPVVEAAAPPPAAPPPPVANFPAVAPSSGLLSGMK